MKRMLFNATQAEELRVAIVEGQKLIDLDIESAAKEQRKSNIYKGVITRVEPSLEAAFVDYGTERHGFLPFKEVARQFFKPGIDVGRARIQDALSEGQELIVQVEKDERGNKGAALTTFISLAGRYLVLMPNNPRGGGVSRRVEGEERNELRDTLDQLQLPDGMSVIARTAAIGRTPEELNWDLNYLMQLWRAVESASADPSKKPFLIYLESSLVIRAIRDYFQPDVGEILIDTEEIYEQARAFMQTVMPGNVSKVKLYRDDVPLFSRFQIEHQIESAYSRQVALPSGGAIVIDHTEALVAIAVHSARAPRGRDIESTALHVLRILQEEAMKENTGAVHAQVPVDVSSFLLNEKRAEIQKLEARLKINIVLVPNPHLETPHYKVQRLRHEELNEMEHVPSSYELVERPEEPKAPGEEAEPKRERQVAVVKSITPDQPAPMPQARPQPVVRAPQPQPAAAAVHTAPGEAPTGIINRLFGWFKAEPVAPAAAPVKGLSQPTPPREPRRDSQQRRDSRPDKQQRREGRAGGDRQQQGRLEQRRNGQAPRGDRRPEQQQRPPRPPQPQQPQQQRAPEREGDEQRRGGRRHRRDRHRERRDENAPVAAPVETQQPVQREEPRPVKSEPAPSPVPSAEAPRIDPKEYLESAGLVMIETDRAKAPAQPQADEQAEHLGRPRRERQKPPAQQDDELVQIETRK